MKKQFFNRISIRLLVLAIFLITAATCYSQKSKLTLEDIYINHTYSPKSPGPVKWYKNGSGYTTLEKPEGKAGKDIVLYRAGQTCANTDGQVPVQEI